jgi:hypothetical protein
MFATDSELTEFRRRVEAYQREPPKRNKHPEYASFVNSIEEVSEISPNDRIGPALRAQGFREFDAFPDGERLVVDVEIWRPSDDEVISYPVRVAHVNEGTRGCRRQ